MKTLRASSFCPSSGHWTAVIVILAIEVGALPKTIKIGGLFDVTDTVQELAFRNAVDRVNADKDVLPRTRLVAQIERIPTHDSFYASKQVCKALETGLAALFGPSSSITSSHVQSICDTLEIPHVESRWDYRLVREDHSINLYPHPQSLGQAYVDVLTALSWKSFVILYEDNEGLVRLQEVLKLNPSKKDKDVKIQVRQLDPGTNGDYRPLLKDLKMLGDMRIVLDCKVENIQEILKQAQQVGIMTAYHSYFVTNLDLQMIELEDFKYGGTNITGLRLVDPLMANVQAVVNEWNKADVKMGRKNTMHAKTIRTETALIYDSVHLFSTALTDLDRSQELETQALSCAGSDTWQHGNSLLNYMKLVELNGLTGKIKFDGRGFRTVFDLDIIELKKEGLAKVGTWNPVSGANFTRDYNESYTEIIQSLHNKTLIVTTILTEPYTMYKENSAALQGNDQFEGYNVDLIDAIAQILGFNYTIKIVADGRYGSYNKETGTWNGMVGELISQKADLAVADLTITYEREKGVDFTMPFMNLGVTILYKKPTAKDPNLFSFLSPLSLGVWIYMFTAYMAVSLLIYIISRLSPYEDGDDDSADHAYTSGEDSDCNGDTDRDPISSRLARPDPIYDTVFTVATGNGSAKHRPLLRSISTMTRSTATAEDTAPKPQTFTLVNSFWFMSASLLQQGTDFLPKAVSTRMVAGVWWFFTLIMISSYTANLAAFLTVERMASPIESAEDLSKQHTIKYGCLRGGSTAAFFRDSKIETYSRMWVFMSSDESNFVTSNAFGVERVLKDDGKYAFLMESTTVEYVIERNCDLTQVGGLLDSKGYGIALPPNSPFRTPMSSAILQLQEGGKLHMLKQKWWKQRKGGGKCTVVKDSGANELNLRNVGGVFIVLIVGLFASCIMACLERCWTTKKRLSRTKKRRRSAKRASSRRRKPRRESSQDTLDLTACTPDSTKLAESTSSMPLCQFENGRVLHLEQASSSVMPAACPASTVITIRPGQTPKLSSGGSAGHLVLASDEDDDDDNALSCAVPTARGMAMAPPVGGMHLAYHPHPHPLHHHRSSGSLASAAWTEATPRGHARYVHQEQCPHYAANDYSDADRSPS